MAFEPIDPITAIKIIDISTQNFDPDPDSEETQDIQYSVQVLMSDGSIKVKTGNLVPELTAIQITTQQTFMAELRALATAQFIPTL